MEAKPSINPEQWVDAYGDYLYRYAFSRLRNSTAAEEVVQETFMAGVKYQHQFKGTGSERGWLLTILKRKIVDYVRARSRRNEENGLEHADPTAMLFDANGRWRRGALPDMAPDRNMQSQELRNIVQDCLSSLPQGQADVFTLSVMEEIESDEICRTLDITPSNFWVRLHRARLGLAKCVSAKWFQGEAKQHVQ